MSRRRTLVVLVLLCGLAAGAGVRALQSPARPAQPFSVVSSEGRRALPSFQVGDQLMVSLDDLAALFELTVGEDTVSGGLRVARQSRSVLLTPGQPLASANGRLVSLPGPVTRENGRWLVPPEFISRALSAIVDRRLEVRRNSRLVLVGNVRVPKVEVGESAAGGSLRLTFTVSPGTEHAISHEGNQLTVRFEADALDTVLPPRTATPLLQGLHLGEAVGSLVLELGPRFGSYRASTVHGDSSSDVVVELVPAEAAGAIQVPPLPPSPPSEPFTPSGGPGSSAVRTVVLDAGHGGAEPGVKGEAASEKDVSLAVARRLRAAIESRLGLRVLMTREAEQAVSLDERAALANNNKAQLFISLHANSAPRPQVKGAQVYYLAADPSGEDARRALLAGGSLPTVGGGNRHVEMILWDMAQVRHVPESAALAVIIGEELASRVEVSQRPIQQGPFRVLAAVNMPAVLVELGFLSNPDEAKKLPSPEHQDLLAQALLSAIVRFRESGYAAAQGTVR